MFKPTLIRALFVISALIPLTTSATEAPADVSVKVKGMVCSFCVQGVEKKLLKLDAVKKVTVDLETKTVKLWVDSAKAVTDAQIKGAIESAGYNIDTIVRKTADPPKPPSAPKGAQL